jgi:tRNA pseudouridine55 synthase
MVDEVRGLVGTRRVGHAGTLDPMAGGLLVILVGRASKLQPYVPGDPKVYRGTVVLGMSTDTMDAEGRVTEVAPCEATEEEVAAAVASLAGEREQVPPMYSAVKHRGKPLYYYARRGAEVDRGGRRITVYGAEMTAFRRGEGTAEVDITISCSPGTYVREIAFHLGKLLGCGGMLSGLRRLASGPFRVEEAVTPRELRSLFLAGGNAVLPPLQALRGYRILRLRREHVERARNGAPLSMDMFTEGVDAPGEGEMVAVTVGEELIGVYERAGGKADVLRARRIL